MHPVQQSNQHKRAKYLGTIFLLLFGIAWLVLPLLDKHTAYKASAAVLFVTEIGLLGWAWSRWRGIKAESLSTSSALNRQFNKILGFESLGIIVAVLVCKALHI